MSQKNTLDNKKQILKAFQDLLEARKITSQIVATKEETAEKQKDKEIIEKASTYTVSGIVKGLADLQLDFGNTLDSVTDKLTKELTKLDELQRAIEVETKQIGELQNVRIVADALDLLDHENKERQKVFDTDSEKVSKSLETEINEKRTAWQKEEKDYEKSLEEKQQALVKERNREEEDHKYEREREHKVESNNYEDRKRKLERDLTEKGLEKEKNWQEREKVFADNKAKFEEYKAKLLTMPEELEKAIKKAREEAIKETYEAEQVKANLLEKENATNLEVYELKIKSLEETIGQQTTQVKQLTEQLQVAISQAQDLTMKAVQQTNKASNNVQSGVE